MISIINRILLGATIIYFVIIIFVGILPAVLAQEPIPPLFIKSTNWVAIIWIVFWLLKYLFVKKEDKSSINEENKDK